MKGEIRPTELTRYELTLALSDGGVTARRGLAVELTPPLLDVSEDLSELSGLTVTVAATAKAKDFVWGVAPAAGGSFAPFANVNGFASAGGSAAALSLATDATVLFDMDELALSLTLTLTAESGEEATGTVTFVSSAREFNGTGLSTRIVTAALAAGTEVFAATEASLTIWHSPNEDETYTLEGANANLFTVGAAGAVSVKGEIRPTELTRYELTLALSDGGVTARRGLAVELTPPLLDVSEDLSELSGLTVTVAATAKAKDFVWGVAPAAGGSFAPFADVNGFASAGGSAAALSLATDATVLFDMDELALSLTLTLTAESGEEATGTVTFVSSAREFNGTGLSTRIVTTALAAGTEVFAATEAGLTIWHSPNESETYTLEGANANLFTVGAAGAVSVKGEIRPTELTRYELTLALSDGGVTARRGLAVELTPPLLDVSEDLSELSGLTVTVAATAKAKDFVWGVAPAAGGSFAPFANVNGFASAGGSAAALSLATDATVLFDMDELALSLTLTLTAESGEEATGTVTFVSSAREFNGTGLSTRIVTAALAAGTEVFAATEASLTIWHSPNEDETYTLEGANANLFTVGAAGAVSVKGEIRPTELTRYELTLALSDGGVTARRGLAVELTPPLLDVSEDLSELSGLTVTVAATAKAKDFVWGVAPPGGSFAPFANVNGFASAGGSAAALSLATDATVLFDMDELALSLTLTLTAESGEEATGTVTFVSSAREFNGTGLFKSIAASMLPAGMNLFTAAEASLTIWHSPNESESYTLEGADADMFDASAAGAVIVKTAFSLDADARYTLTLVLRGGEVEARRDLTLELLSPFLEAAEESPVTVAADALAGLAVFTLSLARQAGVSFDGVEANGLRTEGGNEAEIFLSSSAVDLFTVDRLELSLTLTARDNLREETTTIRFVSAARVISKGRVSLTITQARTGQTILAAGAAEISIWHNNNDGERYTLLQSASDFGVDATTGLVTAAVGMVIDIYDITLQLRDESLTLTASQVLRLIDPERWALLRFLEQIEAGEIAWTDADWDGDKIENPYDWTPTVYSGVTVNLTLDGADPWPIYNVWQLQAIDGVSVSTNGEINGNFNFFGANDLGARYRLALNIDATPTRGWSGGGFQPIGYMNLNPVANDDEGRFVGNLNGAGYEIHGLSVEVDAGHYAGVFSAIGDSGSVASLYFSDLFVSGGGDDDHYVGGLAGSSSGNVFLVGISGRVVRSGDGPIGGLVGLASNGEIVESWFVGEVRADGISDASGIGGLVGDVGFISAEGNALIKNNWAHARVEEGLDRDDGYSGGLIGAAFSGRFQNGWAGGEVVGDRSAGFIGRLDSDFGDVGSSRGYVDFSTSRATKVIENITGDKSVEVVGVETMVTVSVSRWSNEAWSFGDVTVSDGAADYPFLRRYEAMRPGAQALALAGYQTRLFRDGADPDDALVSGDVLTLDTNGAASVGLTPTPTCRDDADGVAAETNYNKVTVLLRATEGVAVSLVAGGGCGVSIGYPDNAADFSILEILSTRGVAVTISHSFAPLLIAGTARPLVVAANAEAGAAVATIDVRGATNPSIDSATAEFLRTGGGVSAAVVSLGDVAATAAFLEDNMMLTLTLTATNDEGATATATIRFVSAPRAIESRQPIEIRLPRRETQAGMTILPAGISGLDILHNGAALERYFLSQSGTDFEAFSLGEVRVRARPGLSAAGLNAGEYRLNLFLTDDSVTARRELRVVVLSLEEEALEAFVADIAADRIDWLGGDIDWDDDGVLNPYDWTPTSVLIDGDFIGVNLTLAGASGEAGSPWPIYNVWQLQAIDGMSVSVDNEARSGFTLFGDSQSVRLSAHYRLAVDIDARPTRDWGDKGFAPIGGEHSNQSNTIEAFTGGFDGGGYAVRGLFINRPNRSFVGLFSAIENPRKMIDLGVEEADIRGQADVGILAGSLHSSRMQSDPFRIDVRRIWTTGKVAGTPGRPPNRNSRRVGGLVGNMGGLSATSFIDLRDSWSTADVRASNVVGGLIGNIARSGTVTVSNSWAAGNVAAMNSVGGFGGFAAGNSWLTRNWSAGAVVGGNSGGFLGNGNATNVTLSLNYWNADTSGVTISRGNGVTLTLSVALQTLSAAYFANDDSWDVGESYDFPLLTALDRPWQAVNLARALTRILGLGDGATVAAAAGTTITVRAFRLDTNGLAADKGTDGTSIPTCSFDDASRVLRAETNYNGVTVELRLLAEEAALIAAAGDCEANIESVVDEFAATLRLEISAPAIDGDPARGLTTDYALRIVSGLLAEARAKFLAEIASGDRKWLGGDSDDWDRDGVLNPYDWTPTSVTVRGVAVSVNLTLGGANGTAGLPWPIYNIWQLQAIDGESVAIDGVVSNSDSDDAASTLFGDSDAERLRAHYRLTIDIDASPTRAWRRADNELGFQPLGWRDSIFQGSFDGQGREIRDLFMRSGDNTGLFAIVGASATVRNLGLRDVDVRSERNHQFIGGLAGRMSGRVSLVWVTGVVAGGIRVGGLAGLLSGGEIVDGWFVGEVEGVIKIGGGLVGESAGGSIRDSWALAELSRDESIVAPDPMGGLIGRNIIDGDGVAGALDNSWAIGSPPAERGAGLIGNNQTQDSVRQAYWDKSSSTVTIVGGVMPASVFSVDTMATVTNMAWSTTAWNFGKIVAGDNNAADYPFLRGSEGFWPGRQALAFADFQTRLLTSDDKTFATAGVTLSSGERLTLVLDTNGLAPNDARQGETPAAQCEDDGAGGIVASANYNDVTIVLRAAAPGTLSDISDCEFVVGYTDGAETPAGAGFLVMMTISAGQLSLSRSYPFLSLEDADGDFWRGDLDADGIVNAYDRIPSAEFPVELFYGADGTAERPWPIYNVWQLQAIGGKSVSASGSVSGDFAFFGASDGVRLGSHYRVAADIDATPTREWMHRSGSGESFGFVPISGEFSGSLDGEGREIRGLWIRAQGGDVGLFEMVAAGATVRRVGLPDVDIRAEGNGVGAVVGRLFGRLSLVWATGRMVESGGAGVGGLAGTADDAAAAIEESWFVGDVTAQGQAGGLLGRTRTDGGVTVRNSWSLGRVETSGDDVGGLIGRIPSADGVFVGDSWSGATVRGVGEYVGGLIGNFPSGVAVNELFLDRSLAGAQISLSGRGDFAGGSGVETMVTVSAVWDESIWIFGDSDLMDGAADYPFLQRAEDLRPGAQAVALADYQTRIFLANGALLPPELLLEGELALRLETNGGAPAGQAPAPRCESDGAGGARVFTNYNNVTILLRVTAGGTMSVKENCELKVGLEGDDLFFEEDILLELTFMAGEASKTRTHSFISLINADIDFWLRDSDKDGTINAYDWTPFTDNGGNLLGDADGSDEKPWPIYNIWHLQAIDGKSVSIEGEITDNDPLFDIDDLVRLSASYRVILDIDATPTRDWDGGRGFDPIGEKSAGIGLDYRFKGALDGDGHVVRGLRINRANDDRVGLFANLRTPARISDLGLDDVRIAGGDNVGAVAGRWSGESDTRFGLRSVWARGRVMGKEDVGGLVGDILNVGTDEGQQAAVHSSWFAGQVAGDGAVGGLAGNLFFGGLEDSWAAVDINARAVVDINGRTFAGDLAGRLGDVFHLQRSWGESFWPESASRNNDEQRSVYYAGIRALAANALGGKWDVGMPVDFPVLKAQSRGLQAAAVASGLTRVAGVYDGANVPLSLGFSEQTLALDFAVMRLETISEVDALDCEFVDGALRAATGFNGATVIMTVISNGWRLASRGDCDVEWVGSSLPGGVTLRLLFVAGDGAAERRLATDYRINVAETLAKAARDQFVKEIETDGFDWFQPASDWDDDGVLNPYDWTPTSVTVFGLTVGVNLTLGGADGMPDSPWPIYNIWQLQAIDGVSVSVVGGGQTANFTLFGATEDERLGGHYRLMSDIDAAPTRSWRSGRGFGPIGDDFYDGDRARFEGSFDGGGHEIRGLLSNDGNTGRFAGLFAGIGSSGRVSRLGLPDVEVAGRPGGALVSDLFGKVSLVWGTGIVGTTRLERTKEVIYGPFGLFPRSHDTGGGLVGVAREGAEVEEAWFVGAVLGAENIGGLIGRLYRGVTVRNTWAMARVSRFRFTYGGFGGLIGSSNEDREDTHNILENSWAGGPFTDAARHRVLVYGRGALVGYDYGPSGIEDAPNSLRGGVSYSDFSTSRVRNVRGGERLSAGADRLSVAAFAVDSMVTVADPTWSREVWDFGMTVAGENNAADYPFLRRLERIWPGRQAVAYADFQTRLINAGETLVPGERKIVTVSAGVATIRLDTNGLAANSEAPAPTCFADGEGVRANTNYNGVTVFLRAVGAGRLEVSGDSCDLRVIFPIQSLVSFNQNMMLSLRVAAGDDSESRLYLIASLGEGEGFTPGDSDGDGIDDVYDWTPTPGVDLTMGADGTAENPWPIYNIWQLQAIASISVSMDGATIRTDLELFGPGDNMTAHYRLAADIDATVTRRWADGGFRSLGGRSNGNAFRGSLVGEGREIRGLWMQSDSSYGLFAALGGEARVSGVGLPDIYVSNEESGSNVGGLAGRVFSAAAVMSSWATGRVAGSVAVGGIAGEALGGVGESWFAGEVAGARNLGGVVGANGGGAANNLWALARVGDDNSDAGSSGLLLSGGGRIGNSWGGGEVAGGGGGLVAKVGDSLAANGLYFDRSISDAVGLAASGSGVVVSGGGAVDTAVDVLDLNWDGDVWNFGRTDAGGGGGADYPVLRRLEKRWPGAQAAALADYQTRLLRASERNFAAERLTIYAALGAMEELRLDTNGLATGLPTPTPSCEDVDGGVRAETNYNGATIWLRTTSSGTVSSSSACGLRAGFVEGTDPSPSSEFSLSLTITAGEAAVSRSYSFALSPLPTELRLPAEGVSGGAAYTTTLSFGTLQAQMNEVVASEGGTVATLILRADATAAFAADGLFYDVTMSVDYEDDVLSYPVRLRSSPRVFGGGTLTIVMGEADVAAGMLILAAGAASISIWHNDNEAESWTLSQSGDDFGADAETGLLTAAVVLERGNYELTLRLTDAEVTASRPLLVSVFADPEGLALNEFIAQVRAGEIDWTVDSDDDGIRNAYDLTPLSVEINGEFVTVNLTLRADGTAENPWPIYNVWHLQAIDGMSVSAKGVVGGGVFDLFAAGGQNALLAGHYRLLADIDATPTRHWGTIGFRPLGGEFNGSLVGDGWEIRGLWMRSKDGVVGLFSLLDEGAAVSRLGLSDLDVEGGQFTGGLAGISSGRVSQVWATGRVVGENFVGGVVGGVSGDGLNESWFVGEVAKSGVSAGTGGVGGLAGQMRSTRLRDVWTAARVSANGAMGGLMVANVVGYNWIGNGWAGGEIFGSEGFGGSLGSFLVYVDESFSNVREIAPNAGGQRAFVTGTATRISDRWNETIWNFGDSEFGVSDRSADYPILRRLDELRPGAQALALANYQTRLLRDGADPDEALASGDVLILDTNGVASDGSAPAPTCRDDADGVTAETNYNNVTVLLRATEGAAVSLVAGGGCDGVAIGYPDNAADFSVLAILSVRRETATISYSFAPLLIAEAAQPLAVAADAGAGAAVVTIGVRGAANPSFAEVTDGPLRTDGGVSAAVVSLVDSAATAFFADNMTLTLTLTATDDEGASATTTIRFVSAPQAIESRLPIEVRLLQREALAGVTILSAGVSGLTIRHNGAAREVYTLSQSGDDFFGVDPSLGVVTVARDLDAGEHRLTLLLTHEGVAARRELRVFVLSPAGEALAVFVAEIASGDRRWLGGDSDDWDGDGVLNPYDWTPTSVDILGMSVGVTLTLGGATGTAESPWLIYNVWQLQAIDGVSVAADGAVRGNFGFFSGSEGVRLDGQYRLALDIDATPTRNWKGTNEGGFRPIGGARPVNDDSQSFSGTLDGAGYEIRGLSVRAAVDRYAGVFSDIHTNGSVVSLHFSDLFVSGGDDESDYVGGLAGSSYGNVSLVGISGRVVRSGSGPAGGLVGVAVGGRINENWFAGEVQAEDGVNNDDGLGGLIGHSGFSEESSGEANMNSNWAHARVEEKDDDGNNQGWVGGLIGAAFAGSFENGWTGGEVIGDRPGGFIGRLDSAFADTNDPTASPPTEFSRGYFDSSTSTATKTVGFVSGDDLVEVFAVDTMVTVSVSRWSNVVWNFGATISDGAADYPFLRRYEAMRPGAQAVAYAARQIRLLAGGLEVKRGEAFVLGAGGVLTLDTNGRAVDHAPSPSCAPGSNSGEVQAATNYNGVTVILRATNGVSLSLSAAGDCVVEHSGEGEAFSILAAVSAREAAQTLSFSFTSAAPSRFSPQPLLSTATANVDDAARLIFVEDIAAGKVDWRIIDPYDWTPTSVTVGGAVIEVNLTLGGADGSAANPWPIYNIWQLQAIASVSVSIDGATMTTGLRLFGDGDNMTAHYRLMNDIDATPTRAWTNGDNAGFAPIPVFRGVLNGDGKVVRGLFIDSGKNNVGLFGELGGGADAARIVSLGLLDARIESRARGVGGFAELMRFKSSIVDSWISGFVRSPSGHNGGLIGENDSSCNVCSVVGGWFAGELETAGSPRIGGIVGRQDAAAGKSDFRGLWSLGEIRTSDNSVTGELHTGGGLIGEITGAQNPASGYWSIETSGVSSSAGGASVVGAGSLQTVTAFPGGETRLEIGATTVSVDFGDSEFSATDAAADFPLLAGDEDWENWQRVGAASGLTRIYAGIGDAAALLTAGATATFQESGELLVRIDANGLAADDPDHEDATSTPTCAARRENNRIFLEADANYNGVTIRVEAEDASGASTGTVSPSNCGILISATAPYTIIVTFTAGADSQKTLTRRYSIVR